MRAVSALLLTTLLFLSGCGKNNATPPPPLSLFTPAVPDGTVGVSYDFLLQAIGGDGTYSWSVASGSDPLPDGLTLDASTGTISGTPTVAGDFTFTIEVTSGTQKRSGQYTNTIGTVPIATLEIFTSVLPNGGTGEPYSYTLQTIGDTGPVTWTLISGGLPGGLTLDTATGVISGTPLKPGVFAFTMQANDGVQIATRDMAITVNIVGPVILEIVTPGLPSSTINIPYGFVLRATGGTGIYTWSIPVGALPDGLVLDKFTGVLSGAPTVVGSFTFTVSVLSGEETLDQPFTIRIGAALNPSVELISRATDPAPGTPGTPGNGGSGDASLTPDGRFVVFTSFADNLTTNDTNANADIFVRDRTCKVTERISISSLTVATLSLPDGEVNATYGTGLAAVGGDAPFTWSVTAGSLPPGLTLDATTGSIAGIPTASGTFGFTVQVIDSGTPQQTASRDFTITIAPAAPPPAGNLAITTDILPDAVTDQPYSFTLLAADGAGALTWTLTAGSLPDGLLLDGSTGAITGTPAVFGIFNFRVEVQDSSNPIQTATKTLSLRVLPDGNQATVASFLPSVSALTTTVSGDFLFVAFATDAVNLVAGDTNNARDIFVTAVQIDSLACTITPVQTIRVSVASDGTEGDGASSVPSISFDGRLVIYESNATNLVLGDDNRFSDVYLTEIDFSTGSLAVLNTQRVSIYPTLFPTPANLFSETTIGNAGLVLTPDIHIREKLEIISGTGLGQLRTITGNDATTFTIDPLWDVIPDTTSVFQIFSTSNSRTTKGILSANGLFAGFSSSGTFGEPNDNLGAPEAFVRDLTTGQTIKVSVNDASDPGAGASTLYALSGAGNLSLFASNASNLIPADTNFVRDLFLQDRALTQTTRVHVANDGSEPNGTIGGSVQFSFFESASMSTSGNLVVYESSATNLVLNDFNLFRDVFLYNQSAGTVTRLSTALDGVEPRGNSFDATISLDGTTVVFTSDAPNLVPNDTNLANDLFLISTSLPAESPLFITAKLAAAEQGIVFEDSVRVAGGQAPLYFAVAEGRLPLGLSLDSRSGRLTGIPQEPGTFSFTVLVMDSTRPSASTRRTFTLTVRPH